MLNTTDYALDNEGYVINPEDWNEELAQALAADEQLELSADYWPVLNYIRAYWNDHKVAPDVRHVIKHLAETQGQNKTEAKQLIFKLFPYGYVKQACRIAGMQRPRSWSTG